MIEFRQKIEKIEHEAIHLINECFSVLRSSQVAFDVWSKFQHLKTRKSIYQLLNEKFHDILKRYEKEMDDIKNQFNEGCLFPSKTSQLQLNRFAAPISGAIKWERQLFNSIRIPMIKFIKIKEFYENEYACLVKKNYVELGKRMKQFEEKLHQYWTINVNKLFETHLNQPILRKCKTQRQSSINSIHSLSIISTSRMSVTANTINQKHNTQFTTEQLRYITKTCMFIDYL